MSLLSVVGKLYGRVQITIVRDGAECAIEKEQCGFRQVIGCIDKVFNARQVWENNLEK